MKAKIWFAAIAAAVVGAIALLLWLYHGKPAPAYFLGGVLHSGESGAAETVALSSGDTLERFGRPSSRPALRLRYRVDDFLNLCEDQEVHIVFRAPEDAVEAWLVLIGSASNLSGFSGGCGSVGYGTTPYPYAYQFLSEDARKKQPLSRFTASFAGVGGITPLQLLPAYTPPSLGADRRCLLVEVEVITGLPGRSGATQPTFFSYYYGLITTKLEEGTGWKIDSMDWLGEDFLCAPAHGWDWDARSMVEIVYGGWYGISGTVRQEEQDGIVSVYVSGTKKYRFDFIRLTNGEDVLLHENILDGRWRETTLLKPEHAVYKLTVDNPMIAEK